MGEAEETVGAWCPDYYPYFIAADRCHCSPWELLEQPIYWREKALIVVQAENQAREQREKMQNNNNNT